MTARRPTPRSALFLLVALCASIAPGTEDAELESGVRIERSSGHERVAAVLPGVLLAYALPTAPGGGREVILLVRDLAEAPPDGDAEESELPPCPVGGEDGREPRLYRLDRTGAGALVPILAPLDAEVTGLESSDLDGDGTDELLLVRNGELLRIAGERLVSVLRDPDLAPATTTSGIVSGENDPGLSAIVRPGLGRLALFGRRDLTGEWGALARVELPLSGRAWGGGLFVHSPVPRFLGRRPDGTLLFATGPESIGPRRLRSFRIDILPDGEATVTEAWARLPSAEDVLQSDLLLFDGRPALLVATKRADKLALFGEKLLRLYVLEPDRSRLGRAPLFTGRSRMNLWQEGRPSLLDVNGDGRDDLVIAYWKGLRDSRVVIDAYLGKEEGVFAARERSTAFDVADGDRALLHYGADLTGDGIADLLLRSERGLLLYPGQPSRDGRKLVVRKPLVIPVEMPSGVTEVTFAMSSGGLSAGPTLLRSSPLRFSDLDGDGRDEILLASSGDDSNPGRFDVIAVRAGQ